MRDFFVRRVLRPLHAAQRWARPSTREALLAKERGLRFRRKAWAWPKVRRELWVLDRLRGVVRRAAETPFYAQRFAEVGFDPNSDFSFSDFAALPILERGDIAEHRGRMRLSGLSSEAVWEDSTGGSTGEPTFVLKGPEERGWGESGSEFFMSRIGCPMGARTGFLWGHHLDPVGSDRLRDRIQTLIRNARWYDCFRMSPERVLEYHRDLQAFQPECILAYANALAPLAAVVEELGETPSYPTRCFVTGAEKLLPHDRKLVERVFGKPVHEQYGSRDVGLMGFQLKAPEKHHFEVDWPKVLVEPLETGENVPILITKLRADAMPMIRYRTGDLGRFPGDARAGRPSFRIEEVLGREVDRLWMPDGKWFHPLGIPHMMKDFPVSDFRLVQAEDYSVDIEVVPGVGFGTDSREQILGIVRDNLPGLEITLKECKDIPKTRAGKRRPVISNATDPNHGPGS